MPLKIKYQNIIKEGHLYLCCEEIKGDNSNRFQVFKEVYLFVCPT